MQYKTVIFFFLTTQLFTETSRIFTHVAEILWRFLSQTENNVFVLKSFTLMTTQGLSDNRYFTGVGFFLRDVNTKHWLWLSANKTKLQILHGMTFMLKSEMYVLTYPLRLLQHYKHSVSMALLLFISRSIYFGSISRCYSCLRLFEFNGVLTHHYVSFNANYVSFNAKPIREAQVELTSLSS